MLNKSDLHDYQRAGVDFIIDHPSALMMLKMGLGKTVTSLTAFSTLKYDMFEVNSALVIAPKRVAWSVWKQEAKVWEHLKHLKIVRVVGTPAQRMAALRAPADIHVVGRDVVDWLIGVFPGKLPWDMLIIDELSSFKNNNSNRFKALKLVAKHFKRRIGLTGTPAPNSLMDLWAQVYLLDDGQRLGEYVTHFRREFFASEGGRAQGGNTFTKYRINKGAEQAIYDKIDDITLSMGLEYLDMPERVDVDIEITLTDALAKKYKRFKRESYIQLYESKESPGEVTAMTAGVLSNKLLQFASGAVYDEERKVIDVHKLKLDAVEELIEAANGEPVIICYGYQHSRDALYKKFSRMGAEVLADDSPERWNNKEIPIMLMHPKSGGHGLNLQAGGSTLIWYDNTWSAEDYDQMVARLFRQGQKADTVSNYHLVTKGTMDERVRTIQKHKLTGQDALMNALKNELAGIW